MSRSPNSSRRRVLVPVMGRVTSKVNRKSAQHRCPYRPFHLSLLLAPRSHLVRLPRLVRPERRVHRVLVARRRVHHSKGMWRGRPAREDCPRGGAGLGARWCRVCLRWHDKISWMGVNG